MSSLVRRWIRREIVADRSRYRGDMKKGLHAARVTLREELELGSLLVSTDEGGLGWSCPDAAPGLAAIIVELGRGDAALATTMAVDQALLATAQAAGDENKSLRRLLGRWATKKGSAAASVVLPGAGLVGEETPLFRGRAVRVSLASNRGRLTLRGSRLRVIGDLGPGSGMLGVVCATSEGAPALAIIESESSGIRRGKPRRTAGLEVLGLADLTLDRVSVTTGRVLVGEAPVMRLMIWLDLLLGAASLGAALDFFDILIAWAEDRPIKGGGLLRDNPLCAALLAHCAEEIATAHLLLYDLAAMIAADHRAPAPPTDRLFAYAQILGGRVQRGAFGAIDRGRELMGSAGYAVEWHVEKHWRDVKSIQAMRCGVGGDVLTQMDAARYFASGEV